MFSALLVTLVHTFGAELIRRAVGVPGAVKTGKERLQYVAFAGPSTALALLKFQFGYVAPAWLVAELAVSGVLLVALIADRRRYWLLSALALAINVTLASVLWSVLGGSIVCLIAFGSQFGIAFGLRRIELAEVGRGSLPL